MYTGARAAQGGSNRDWKCSRSEVRGATGGPQLAGGREPGGYETAVTNKGTPCGAQRRARGTRLHAYAAGRALAGRRPQPHTGTAERETQRPAGGGSRRRARAEARQAGRRVCARMLGTHVHSHAWGARRWQGACWGLRGSSWGGRGRTARCQGASGHQGNRVCGPLCAGPLLAAPRQG
jgi:hypothetical protein